MLTKRTFTVIFLFVALCLAGFAQTSGSVVVLQTELQDISGIAWLPNHLQNLIEENLQKYTDFTTVVDESAERKVKQQQRRSESLAHSESDIIEIGKLVNAKYALFSFLRKTGSTYTLSIDFTDLTTGVHRASITSQQYSKLEDLYARPGAVDEVTLSLCSRLGIALSAAQKYVLQHGEHDLSVSQQLELEKKEQERFRQQIEDLDKQIAMLNTSAEADAETQQKKIAALRAMNEQKLKAAQEREKRLREDQKRRQADMVAEASRKEASIQRRNSLGAEIELKVKNLRAVKMQNANIMERIGFLGTKKKTFNELQEELVKRQKEIDASADKEFNAKKTEIEARPWRAAELANGIPSAAAVAYRKDEITSIWKNLKKQAEMEKSAVEKELKPTSDALLNEIIDDYRILENTTVTISSIRNEKDIQYSIGTFNGNENVWSVLLYFYNDGKEGIGQYQTFISYQAVTGKKSFSEMKNDFRNKEQEEVNYNDFLDTVDMYNSLFARNVPVLTYEVDYTVEPMDVPSRYRICFKELRIKDTQSGSVLIKEKIADLDKIISFPECQIKTSYYAQIISPKDKNIPAYILYRFALNAEKNGDNVEAFILMRRAAEKNYRPALEYIKSKESKEHEKQRMASTAKANDKELKKRKKELEKKVREKEQKKKTQEKKLDKKARNAMYRIPHRLGFSLSGDFSPTIQNYAFEMKYLGVQDSKFFMVGGGINTWFRNGSWDILCPYILFNWAIPLERIRPYFELGGGMGGVNISKSREFGFYGYVKGGVEARLSPNISIDVFCRPQGYFYLVSTGETYIDDDGKTRNKANRYGVKGISGGASIILWKLFN